MSSVFRVGDRVQVSLGRRRLPGVITEDRGAIGLRGRHLYQVLVPMDPFEPTTFELPEDEIERMEGSVESGTTLGKNKVIDYLANGGLIAILRSNYTGGRNQPRVWLRPDSAGNVTHTFEKERGVVGGATVPFMAMHDDKIFSPKRGEVLSFLQSFDLDCPAAERVISLVRTAPRKSGQSAQPFYGFPHNERHGTAEVPSDRRLDAGACPAISVAGQNTFKSATCSV